MRGPNDSPASSHPAEIRPEVIWALRDSRRQIVLQLLQERPLSTREMAAAFDRAGHPIGQSGLTHHLHVLRTAGWIRIAAETRGSGREQARVWQVATDTDWRELVEALNALGASAAATGSVPGPQTSK